MQTAKFKVRNPKIYTVKFPTSAQENYESDNATNIGIFRIRNSRNLNKNIKLKFIFKTGISKNFVFYLEQTKGISIDFKFQAFQSRWIRFRQVKKKFLGFRFCRFFIF